MIKNWVVVTVLLAAANFIALAANAADLMPTGDRTTQPVGHWELCQVYASECSGTNATTERLKLTEELWSSIVDVNSRVNAAVKPMTDMEIWGREEVWSFPDNGMGDCEDYVLGKRRELQKLGVPTADLLITVVRQTSGAGHAVLTVRTDRGDFILDNLESKIVQWYETSYTYLKRQSERAPGQWVSIEDGRAVAVGSIR
ncbi:MAG: transglutaminase-like cysteine peptidase [Methylobacterium mesophilicum]|nr:transglutaminase-like cysteine peptidase [Methylobacterium mesophilicum]